MLTDHYKASCARASPGIPATGVVADNLGRVRLFAELGAAKPILIAMGIPEPEAVERASPSRPS